MGKSLKSPSANPLQSLKDTIQRMGSVLIVFSDASVLEDREKCVIGAVGVNEKGEIRGFTAKAVRNPSSVFGAELIAIKEGINLAKSMGSQNIISLSDCLEAVTAIRNNEIVWNLDGYILGQIREELHNFLAWEVLHIPRNFNKASHILAKSANASATPLDWFGLEMQQWIQGLDDCFS